MMAASSEDAAMEDMERGLEKQRLCWNAWNMDDSSHDMIWVREDECQGPEWSVVESNRKKRDHATESSLAFSEESVKRVKVGNKSNDVSEWKVVMMFD